MMWGVLYISIGAFATIMTWSFAVREEAIVFTSAFAVVSWAVLALQPEIVLISNGTEVAIEVGAWRWALAALSILSVVALFGAVTGIYPDESHPETEFSEATNVR